MVKISRDMYPWREGERGEERERGKKEREREGRIFKNDDICSHPESGFLTCMAFHQSIFSVHFPHHRLLLGHFYSTWFSSWFTATLCILSNADSHDYGGRHNWETLRHRERERERNCEVSKYRNPSMDRMHYSVSKSNRNWSNEQTHYALCGLFQYFFKANSWWKIYL